MRLLGTALTIAIVAALSMSAFILLSDADYETEENMNKESVPAVDPTAMHVAAGDDVTIALKGNITTGFDWKVVSSGGLELLKDYYISDDKSGMLCGAGGVHYFVFKCPEKGTYDLSFDYERSWEADPIETHNVKVIVE